MLELNTNVSQKLSHDLARLLTDPDVSASGSTVHTDTVNAVADCEVVETTHGKKV